MHDNEDDDDDLGLGAIDDGPDVRESAIYQKAIEIQTLAIAIVEAAPDELNNNSSTRAKFEERMLMETKDEMMGHAYLIPGKIAGAYGLNMYDLQMENAALVRRACRELVVCLRGLEIAGHLEEDHFNLLRTAVNEFQPLFAEWVATFQNSFYLWDDWGLFNPPGALPDTD